MLRVQTVITGVSGGPYYSNFFFNGVGLAQAEVAADLVNDFWQLNSSLICTPAVLQPITEVVEVDEATGQITQSHVVAEGSYAFTGSGEAAPTASQLLVQWRTNAFINGRRIRGRTFLPYLVITIIDDGRVLASAAATVKGRADQLISDSGAAGLPLVVWSRTHGTFAAVETSTVWNELAVLRSRRDA